MQPFNMKKNNNHRIIRYFPRNEIMAPQASHNAHIIERILKMNRIEV